jgi:hypothetical protein
MAPAHHRVEEMSQMPKASKESFTEIKDFGVAEDRTGYLDGYTVNFVSIRQDHDLAPMLSGLPGGRCQCPHWGYVVTGRMIVRYADREEAYEAGDAFYMPPGHTPAAEAGSEIIQFSPSDQLQEVEAAIMRHMQQMQGT